MDWRIVGIVVVWVAIWAIHGNLTSWLIQLVIYHGSDHAVMLTIAHFVMTIFFFTIIAVLGV